jgi:hypothetical protein
LSGDRVGGKHGVSGQLGGACIQRDAGMSKPRMSQANKGVSPMSARITKGNSVATGEAVTRRFYIIREPQ